MMLGTAILVVIANVGASSDIQDIATTSLGPLADADITFLRDLSDIADADDADVRTAKTLPSRRMLVWALTSGVLQRQLQTRSLRFLGVHFDYRIDLADSTVELALTFDECTFSEIVSFERAKVQSLRFRGSTFEERIWLIGAQIRGECRFEQSETRDHGPKLRKGVNLNQAHVGGDLEFSGGITVEVGRPDGWAIRMAGAKVDGRVLVGGDSVQLKVNGSANLECAKCAGLLIRNVDWCQPNKDWVIRAYGLDVEEDLIVDGRIVIPHPIGFQEVKVGGDLTIAPDDNSTISKIYLAGAHVGRNLSISTSIVGSVIDLESVIVDRSLVLFGVPHSGLTCDLTCAKCQSLFVPEKIANFLNYEYLDLDGERKRVRGLDFVEYSSLGIGNSGRHPTRNIIAGHNAVRDAIDSQTRINGFPHPDSYRQLAKVLLESGHQSKAREVLMELERRRSSEYSWIWSFTVGPMTGWGYQPLQVGIVIIVVWCIGSAIFLWHAPRIESRDREKPVRERSSDGRRQMSIGRISRLKSKKSARGFNAPLYVLDVMTPLIKFGQDDAYFPRECSVWLRGTVHLLRAIGWWMITIFAVGLTRFVS